MKILPTGGRSRITLRGHYLNKSVNNNDDKGENRGKTGESGSKQADRSGNLWLRAVNVARTCSYEYLRVCTGVKG